MSFSGAGIARGTRFGRMRTHPAEHAGLPSTDFPPYLRPRLTGLFFWLEGKHDPFVRRQDNLAFPCQPTNGKPPFPRDAAKLRPHRYIGIWLANMLGDD